MELFSQDRLKSIGSQLVKKNETIAVAESVTAGLLQFAFSNIPDASCFFQGGLTAYNLAQKFKHLHIEPQHASSCNCVSPQVANEMALGVCRQYATHWSIGITGYATPVPESGNEVFAYYSIIHKNCEVASGILRPEASDPSDVQLKYVQAVLHELSVALKEI